MAGPGLEPRDLVCVDAAREDGAAREDEDM